MSLRNILDRMKPSFEEGGKLHSFKSVFEGMETFLYVNRERIFMMQLILNE